MAKNQIRKAKQIPHRKSSEFCMMYRYHTNRRIGFDAAQLFLAGTALKLLISATRLNLLPADLIAERLTFCGILQYYLKKCIVIVDKYKQVLNLKALY
jgi:hypothetical protein